MKSLLYLIGSLGLILLLFAINSIVFEEKTPFSKDAQIAQNLDFINPSNIKSLALDLAVNFCLVVASIYFAIKFFKSVFPTKTLK
ncbi:hypothetical protein BH11VER1_BH11VER1_31500 [soil metagenome]